MGDDAVKLQKHIGDLTKKIGEETAKRGDAEKRITAFSQQAPLAQFMALGPVPGAQQQIDALRKRTEAARNAAALALRQAPTRLVAPTFDASGFFAVLAKKLGDIEKDAEAVVRQHFAKHPAPPGIESWISSGQQFASADDCPFCGQKLEGLALIEAYKRYFNKAYEDLKQQVATLEQKVGTGLADARIKTLAGQAITNAALIEAWKDQLDLAPPVLPSDQLLAAIAEARARATTLAAAKQGQPLDAFGTASDETAIEKQLGQIEAAVDAYNKEITAAISAIDEFKTKTAAENVQLLEAQVHPLEIAIARQHPDAAKAIVDYRTADTERKQLDKEKTQTRTQLDELMAATLSRYQAQINQLLITFGAGFSIEQMKPNYQGTGEPRTEYGLRLRNKPVPLGTRKDAGAHFGSTLSEGDKRTLAFAFFLARVNADPANLSTKCAQMIILSHDAYFAREQRDMLAKTDSTRVPRLATISRVQGDYSAFAACDIDDLCASDYYRHHRQLSEYVAGTNQGSMRDAAKAIRLFLEGFYHRRFPGLLPKRGSFGVVIDTIAKAPQGSPISNLQPRVEEMTKLNIYAGRFHHDTNPGNADTAHLTDAELKTYVERALALVYKG